MSSAKVPGGDRSGRRLRRPDRGGFRHGTPRRRSGAIPPLTESVVEDAALDWFRGLDYRVVAGPELPVGGPGGWRESHADAVFPETLRDSLAKLNPDLPDEALDTAARTLLRPQGSTLETRNRAAHRMIVEGVAVAHRDGTGETRYAQAKVVDFDDADANDWVAVNQFTVRENRNERRADIVVFVNGLPLAVFELKSPADQRATLAAALRQLQTCKAETPSLFVHNAVLAISDGVRARLGTLTAGLEWFKPWRTVEGEELAPAFHPELRVLIEGAFEKDRFLELLRGFIAFEDTGGAPAKKIAGYHQFHAVRAAVAETRRAAALQRRSGGVAQAPAGRYETGRRSGGATGDRRIGVVWHTQGSGKSLTMAFYAGRVARDPAMGNPTVVVLTDRNDLDDQLFATFARCPDLLGQAPEQAQDRADLRAKLAVPSGGVVFSTIQKFFPDRAGGRHPALTERRNVVVIADEAHRGQYDFIDGYARHMRDALPNASFVGFTGTPIERRDADTRAVFGDYISVYDVRRAVEDRATVPIYYESRLARLELDAERRPRIDADFEEATEGEEVARKERLKTRWAQLEAVVGAERRLALVARDIVSHFEARLDAMDGKAMVVCMSRRICVDLYRQLARLRPDWRGDGDGGMKVVMTGAASDPPEWREHIRNKTRREDLARRFRDPADPFRIVLVRDMWLTGFDAPSLHTLYLDKPMRGHGLMQTIARVNRVFADKPGGLVVDYLGLARELRAALATYTESGGEGSPAFDQAEAVAVMREKYEVCAGLFHGFDRAAWTAEAPAERLALLPAAQEHVLALPDGKERLTRAARELVQAFALAAPHEDALAIRDDVAFFQAVASSLAKRAPGEERPEEELDRALRGIVSRAVTPDGVVDVFAAAGLKKPDVSVLSDEFLAEVRGMPRRHLAVELLRKLLTGELTQRRRANVVRARSFAEMLERTLERYRNRAVEAAQVIEELVALARGMREANARGAELGLTDEELAFYDALETGNGAAPVPGEAALCAIARELADVVRRNVTVDWTLRESARANLRRLVRRVLRKHGYPRDGQDKATRNALEQAAALSAARAP